MHPTQDEQEAALEKKLAALEEKKMRGETGFETWLRALPLASLEIVYEHSLIHNANAAFSKEYVDYMRLAECLKMCGS